MRYFALAVDFDETLATDGHVPTSTESSLQQLKATGRQLILVTGRTMASLTDAWPKWRSVDALVAENGGVLAFPRSHEVQRLAPPPNALLLKQLGAEGVAFSAGDVVVALTSADAARALGTLRHTGLDAHIVFNGDSAMVLPAGVSKASGLDAALTRMQLSHHEVVGIGNEANDRVFLEQCECAFAVANATSVVKESCDFVTKGAASVGVEEVVAELVEEDLGRRTTELRRSTVPLGRMTTDSVLSIPAYGLNLLIAGASGSGKSTFATGLAERLIEKGYQVLVLDPEGDYTAIPSLVSLGDRRRPPNVQEILTVLENPSINVNANLLAIPFYDRPKYFSDLLPNLQAMRARTGRPHWIFVDEAHHFLPVSWRLVSLTMPLDLGEVVMITVRPQEVAPEALDLMTLAVAVGPQPVEALREVAGHAASELIEGDIPLTQPGRDVLCWDLRREGPPRALRIIKGRVERLRHQRKYAEGDLGSNSFFFTGAHGAMNIRIQNLMLFVQIAQGIDDDTWLYHLRRRDYSQWLHTAVKDPELADKVAQVEARDDLGSRETRLLICDLLTRKYSL